MRLKNDFVLHKSVMGSRLFGTNTPLSDYDYAAVIVPPYIDVLMGYSSVTNGSHKIIEFTDTSTYPVAQFFAGLKVSNMTHLEFLFSTQLSEEIHPLWRNIWDNRDKLVTRKPQSMIGYCRAQANMYDTRGEKVEAVRLVLEEIMENESGSVYDVSKSLQNAMLKYPKYISTETVQGQHGPVDHLVICVKRFPFTASAKTMKKPVEDIIAEYGARTKAAVNNNGTDWKGMMHAVRISEQAIEYLNTGFMTFPRPNADLLKTIRHGGLSVNYVSEMIKSNLAEIDKSVLTSKLPDAIDMAYVEETMKGLYA